MTSSTKNMHQMAEKIQIFDEIVYESFVVPFDDLLRKTFRTKISSLLSEKIVIKDWGICYRWVIFH